MQKEAIFRFKGSLADFFASERDSHVQKVSFNLNPAAKDLIESQGVPHVEVYALAVNGSFRPLSYNVQSADELVAYPEEQVRPFNSKHRARDIGRCPEKFVADVHLGKLVRLLRLLGINTAYSRESDDAEIISQAVGENRAVLSRDLGLLKHGALEFGYWPRSTDPEVQVEEVLDYFELRDKVDPFTRCMKCNGWLESATLDEVAENVPPNVKSWCSDYRQCQSCEQVYWKGSHFRKLITTVNKLLDEDYSVDSI
ncbi:MAG: Mut7-C RNAse domain-containing protein [Balneolaceae bacterium]|nr:Mut7-C RNAse domain-containing protein [Balneolaceae bacterium]